MSDSIEVTSIHVLNLTYDLNLFTVLLTLFKGVEGIALFVNFPFSMFDNASLLMSPIHIFPAAKHHFFQLPI